MSYERHYDISLLDDIHNYFPALLYGPPEQFHSVQDLLAYVRSQVRQRFDLFSSAHRAYAPTQVVATRPVTYTMTEGGSLDLLRTTMDLTQLLSYINTIPLNPNMIPLGSTGTTASLAMDPVVVRPTAAQVAAGSAIEVLDAEEEVCAICQDDMTPGSEVRALTVCDHRFHVACIDTWFQRNVRCPTCRHDIRETGT